MNNFIESLKNYSSSKGYEQVQEEGYDLVLQKKVDKHTFKVSVSKEQYARGLFSLEILNSDQKVVAFANMRTAEFMDFNDLLDVSFDNLYENVKPKEGTV